MLNQYYIYLQTPLRNDKNTREFIRDCSLITKLNVEQCKKLVNDIDCWITKIKQFEEELFCFNNKIQKFCSTFDSESEYARNFQVIYLHLVNWMITQLMVVMHTKNTRYTNYINSDTMIQELNSDPNIPGDSYGHTVTSDMTEQEVGTELMGLDEDTMRRRRRLADADIVPSDLDFNSNFLSLQSYANTVQKQGLCGSGWTFAATGQMEEKEKWSEQYMVDCAPGSCDGGSTTSSADWLQANGYVCTFFFFRLEFFHCFFLCALFIA